MLTGSGQRAAAMQQLKKAEVESLTLTFYDVTQLVTIQCDASLAGLGACLTAA